VGTENAGLPIQGRQKTIKKDAFVKSQQWLGARRGKSQKSTPSAEGVEKERKKNLEKARIEGGRAVERVRSSRSRSTGENWEGTRSSPGENLPGGWIGRVGKAQPKAADQAQ
jgi:hypothetical protein